MSASLRAAQLLGQGESLTLSSLPEGYDAFVLADVVRRLAVKAEDRSVVLVHVARDSQRAQSFTEALNFAEPQIEVLDFPSWDCQPYDRVSPNSAIAMRRMIVLSRLARTRSSGERPRILSTTVNALLQRVPPYKWVARESFSAAAGNAVDLDALMKWLETNGFQRASTVNEPGEYAVRGGIIDLFPSNLPQPVRLDFFGDTLDTIRTFDIESQRSTGQIGSLDLVPMSEVQLTTESMRRFRQAYVTAFGGVTRGDQLYETVSEGRRYPGMEHWLPLFHEELDSLLDYVGAAPFVLDDRAGEVMAERFSTIRDHFENRQMALDTDSGHTHYKPLPPNKLYFDPAELQDRLNLHPVARILPFARPDAEAFAKMSLAENIKAMQAQGQFVDCAAKIGRNFAPERNTPEANVFEVAIAHIKAMQQAGRRVIVAGWSDGSRERLGTVLADHGLKKINSISTLAHALTYPRNETSLAVLSIETGFETDELVLIGEQDLLGDRLVRQRKKQKRSANFLREVAALSEGDLVVHVDHGIGRFIGLKNIEAGGQPHDCLEIHYAGDTKLFLPVENLELLSRYGNEDAEAQLDRLGSTGWQTRKARMKKRIREIAHGLIKIAAERLLKQAPRLIPPEGAYDEFCARFAYDETEDQQNAIDATLDDLAAGKPMDRLICGDVGFGKTEVALRAAFVAAINGKQVAVIVPTTLLARQHFKNFSERFAGLPIRVAQASRMVSAAEMKATKTGLADGQVDIVIGTHALLGKGVAFKDLGLVIVDEEQHFGVGHKERLKDLRAEVHVLTLSATPIPRTLQLALTGVRELSIIATPPVDRLAVRSFITPFDPLIVREALLRERYRGGQSFYVCPRIDDLDEAAAFLRKNVPEAKFVVAHGQMAASELEDKMSAFYEGKYDILLSTTIIESGIDIPRANTLIVHRADMFGLGQLYQLRGRVGRSKTRAYALFTLPEKRLTAQAEKRLKVLQTLDTLGAGFQLATHDLDIRGAGNLLGDEQSGHIKEVGFELYQQMLEDAVAALKSGEQEPVEEAWSPNITIGTPVTIPEDYVQDLSLRLNLYRRLSTIDTDEEIETMGAELIDRFGPMPPEVQQLLKLVSIKALARRANVEKVDAGPKGVILSFRDNSFANPNGLVRYIAQQGVSAKVRPDMRIVFIRDFDEANQRLEGTRLILRALVGLAEKKAA